jgi:hypothetical protein
MLEPIVIEFGVGPGFQTSLRAFDTIEKRMERFEKNASRQAAEGGRARSRSTDTERREREAAYKKLFDQIAKDEKTATVAAVKAAKEKERAAVQAAKAASAETKKAAEAEVREAQKVAREVERLETYKMRVRIRSSEMAGQAAARAATEELRAIEKVGRAQASASKRMGGRIGGIVSSSVGGTLGSIASLGGAALGLGGGALLIDAARNQLADQKQAALLVNAVTTGGAPPSGASVGNILAQASQSSRELGVDRGQLIGAALEYSRKARGGDFAGAMDNMGFFGKMAKVTGADINEIAGAAGILQSQNQSLKAPAMQQMLLDVYAQGKQGSMSMVDVAKQIGILGAPATSFAGDQATTQRKLLGLGQLAAPQGTIEEAGTFIKDLVSEAASHRKSTRSKVGTEQMGVKFDQYGRMESPEQMIESVMRYTKGDVTEIEGIFGKRGTPLFRSLLKPYTDAGGGEKGIDAVRATMAGVTTATMTSEQLGAQNAVIDSTDAQKFTNAANEIQQSLTSSLAPSLSRLATTLKDHEGDISAFVRGLAEVAALFIANPFKGIGAIVLLSVMKDLAGAGIGVGVKAALQALIASMSAGSAAGAGVSGVGAAGAAAGVGAGVGLAVVGATAGAAIGAGLIINADAEGRSERNRAALSGSLTGVNAAMALYAKARSGTTPEDIRAAQAQFEVLRKDAADKREAAAHAGGWSPGSGFWAMGDRKKGAEGEARNAADALKLFTDALAKATQAAQNASSGVKNDPARHGPINERNPPHA